MPHRNQLATPKVKDIERPLDITRPFMDDIEVTFHAGAGFGRACWPAPAPNSASTAITTASRLTGHPGSRQSATGAPIGEPHLTTHGTMVSRLAIGREVKVSTKTPLGA